MKTIKTSILTLIAAVVILCGVNTSTYSAETQTVTISVNKKPGPNYIWIAGHYKHNKFGKLIWVPGHWKRV